VFSAQLRDALAVTEPMRPQVDGLAAFHAGERSALDACYRAHAPALLRALEGYLGVADRETVVHEVFFKLLSNSELRESFTGGSMEAWLCRIAVNQALNYIAKYHRPTAAVESAEAAAPVVHIDSAVESRLLIERFRRECLPPKWDAVFEARFLRQLDQRSAAGELGIYRTTLAYQELRIRKLLRRFLFRMELR
jgi:RNA polymerase sigma-70 factor (ECF subfamily)